MIYTATAQDIDSVVRMGRKFHDTTPYADVPYCPDSIRYICHQLIEQGLLLIGHVDGEAAAMLGVTIGPLFMNRDALVASEMFWWVEPHARNSGIGKQLVAEMESICKARGVYRFAVMALHGAQQEKTTAMYARMGFEPTEYNWSKVLWER